MLNRDEVEFLIRITRENGKHYDMDYEVAYKRVEALHGHTARMNELKKMDIEWKAEAKEARLNGAIKALDLLFVLNGGSPYNNECKLADQISCTVCPFNLGGPCALRSILNDRHQKTQGSYPRNVAEDIAKGVKAQAIDGIIDENRARIKKAVNYLLREEGKPEIV